MKEYKTDNAASAQALEEILNERAREGWELVKIVTINGMPCVVSSRDPSRVLDANRR